MNNREVAQLWADMNPDRSGAIGSHFSFGVQRILFSYGLPIARLMPNGKRGKPVALINRFGYSNSTSIHTGLAVQAVRERWLKVFYVSENCCISRVTPAEVLTNLISKIAETYGSAQRENIREVTVKRLALVAEQQLAEAKEFAKLFKLKFPYAGDAERVATQYLAEKQRKMVRILAARKAAATRKLNLWRAGKVMLLSGRTLDTILMNGQACRLVKKGERVFAQTTSGYALPLWSVRSVLRRVVKMLIKGVAYDSADRDILGVIKIGHYWVDHVRSESVKVGCNRFSRDEVLNLDKLIKDYDAGKRVPVCKLS